VYYLISTILHRAPQFVAPALLLWPESIRHDDVLLIVIDAAPYMIKAANSLKAFYSKMMQVTCLEKRDIIE
jgi:hypothetical protein